MKTLLLLVIKKQGRLQIFIATKASVAIFLICFFNLKDWGWILLEINPLSLCLHTLIRSLSLSAPEPPSTLFRGCSPIQGMFTNSGDVERCNLLMWGFMWTHHNFPFQSSVYTEALFNRWAEEDSKRRKN